jgi:lipid-A-disaccharide synthase
MKIYLIAGEASGDNIGAKLIKALKSKNSTVEFYGIGGEKMQEQGMNLLFPSQELAVMGFFEIIPSIFKFIKLIKKTIDNIVSVQPDIVVTIDSPGFCFRVAKAIKDKFRGKLVHYVAPTVWAYKPERAKNIAQIYDHLLVILPFEPEYFLKEGLDTTFVGHPAIEDLSKRDNDFKEKYKIPADDLLVCLAPGSRKQEVKSLLPVFLESIELLQNKVKQKITLAIPVKSNLRELINSYQNKNLQIKLIDEKDKEALFSNADLALSKSGTITTELAFYNLPMVVAHKVNQLSYWLLKRMIKVKYVSIINILAAKELVPELLQDKCNPKDISEQLHKLSIEKNNSAWKEQVQKQLKKLQVDGKSASQLAAEKILSLLGS